MTCPMSRQDGAYLLGALSPQERRTFEEHLANCPICSVALSEVAGLPGLLARLPEQAVEATDPPPTDLLPSLLRIVDNERRRSRWRVRVAVALAAATAIVAIALLGTAVLPPDQPRPTTTAAPSTVAMTRLVDIPIQATAALSGKPWGTEIDLRCVYTEQVDHAYPLVLWAVDRAGHGEQIAVWDVVPNGEARVVGSTSLQLADLAVLEVRTKKGKAVLRLNR